MARASLSQTGVEFIVVGNRQAVHAIEEFNAKLKSLEHASAAAAGAGGAIAKVGAVVAAGVVGATVAIGALAAGIATVGGIATKVAAEFQQSMAVVAAVTRAPEEQLRALVGTIQDIASTSVVSMHQAAEAAGELARAGVDVDDQLQGALKAVTNLSIASAGELGLDKAARLVATALNAWQLPGSEAANVANAITVAAQKSAISFNDLMRSFQQVSPIAAALKIPIQDVSAALGVMGLAGLRGSDAGTSLKQMFIQLEKPSAKAAALMKEYGIGLFDTEGRIRPLRDLVLDLSTKLGEQAVAEGKLTEAQRHHALATIFGSDAIRAALVLSNLGVVAFDELRGSMDDSAFSAEELARIIQAPLSQQLIIVWNNIQKLLEALGRGLIPIFGEVTAAVLKFVQSFDPNKLILVGQAIGVLISGQGFGALTKAIHAATGATEQFDTVNEETGETIVETRTRASALGSVLITLVNFFRNVGIAASLIIQPLVDIAKRILGVANSGDSLQTTIATINSLGKTIITVAATAGALIAAFADVVGAAFSLIGTIGNLIKNFLQLPVVMETIKTVLVALAGVALVALGVAIASAVGAIGAFIAANGVWIAAILLGAQIVRMTASIIIDNWDTISQVAGNVVSFLGDVWSGFVNFYGDTIATLIGFMTNWIAFWFDMAANIADVIDNLLTNFGMVPTGIGNALRRAAEVVRNILNTIGQTIANFVNQLASLPIIGEAMAGAGAFFAGIGEGIGNVAEAVGGFVEQTKNLIAAAPRALSSMDNLAGGLKEISFSAGGGRGGGAAGGLRDTGEAASQAGPPIESAGDKAGKAGKQIEDAGTAIEGFVRKLAELVRQRALIDAFGELGADAVGALIEAVVENTAKAGEKAAEAMNKFVDELRRNELSDWEELGVGLATAFEQTLILRTDEAIQAAIEVVGTLTDRLKASGALSPETFSAAFDKAGIKARLQSDGASFMEALRTAIIDGGQKAIQQMADSALQIMTKLTEKLSPDKAKQHIDALMDAIANAIEFGTPEVVGAVSHLIQEINLDVQLDEVFKKAEEVVKDRDRAIADIIENSKTEKAVKEARDRIEKEIDSVLDRLKQFQDQQMKAFQKRVRAEDLQRDRRIDDEDLQRQRQIEDAENRVTQQKEIQEQQIKINNALKENGVAEEEIAEMQRIQKTHSEEIDKLIVKRKQEDAERAYKRKREDEELRHRDMREQQAEQFREMLEQQFERAKNQQQQRLIAFDREQEQISIRIKMSNIQQEAQKKLDALAEEEKKIRAIQNLANTMFDGAIQDIQRVEQEADGALDEMLHESEEILHNMQEMARINFQQPIAAQRPFSMQAFQEGGIVPGVGPQLIMAHGREVITPPDVINKVARQLTTIMSGRSHSPLTVPVNRPWMQPTGSTVNNYNSYNVAANYSQVQSEATVILDMRALVAASSK